MHDVLPNSVAQLLCISWRSCYMYLNGLLTNEAMQQFLARRAQRPPTQYGLPMIVLVTLGHPLLILNTAVA